jgi:hypothetical protein
MRQLLGINLKVQCADGTSHDGVKLYVEDTRRVYLAEDGSELGDVDLVLACTAVVPPMLLTAALQSCKETG